MIDTNFDNELRDFLESFGLHMWASGFDFQTGYRDIAFERK